MTAVAPPPNFQNIARQGWSAPNASTNGDDLRMFMPRKSVQRSNSSSSLASTASGSSTVSNTSSQANGVVPSPAGEGPTWARKKAPRGIWTAAKSEPISGITTARPQSIASAGLGASATTAMTALHAPAAPMVPSQHNGTSQAQQNGAVRSQTQESPAILHLIPMNGTFERKTITVPFFPEVLRVGRQTNNKTIPTPLNGYFDSKVLSRQHAEIWADRNGKIWIRDVKSSNGTFVNGQRLSQENRDSDPHELREQDMLELGIDIVSEDQKTIVHHKVAARVEHAGIYTNSGSNMMDLNFGELETSQLSNLMGTGTQQQLMNMRGGRTPSQGSLNGQRLQGPAGSMGNNVNGIQPPRPPNFWLQPITMEQVVKKLNAEIKAARQQAIELQNTNNFINTILTTDPKTEPSKPSQINSVKISPIKDLKTRFLEPPAPPPQQPLPEKPDAPSFKRADTEKPKNIGSPVRSDAQMSTLTEALSSAKKEIESQGIRLRDLETLLNEERRAREDAEERANRLERESIKEREPSEPTLVDVEDNDSENIPRLEKEVGAKLANGSASPTLADTTTTRLQQRLELMMAEMNEMKQQMERYRERAETAEADRKSLAEMIESIRQDNAEPANTEAKHSSSSDNGAIREPTDTTSINGLEDDEGVDEGDVAIINEKDTGHEGGSVLLRRAMQNGRAVVQDNTDPKKTSQVVTSQLPRNSVTLASGAPAMSILAVVAMGVAVMAYLNSLPKVER